jgi:CheY-like chemotaxis protein
VDDGNQGLERAQRLPPRIVVSEILIPGMDGLSVCRFVIDDNAATAESLSILLGMWGHEVATAASGAEALELAASFDPQIVLLDIGLPGMEGYEVARRLRAELHLNPAIVAMTGYGREEDRRRSREAGLHAHLVKPVEPDALKALLTQIAGDPEPAPSA